MSGRHRRDAYRWLRRAGDLDAARRGPGALGKRLVRRQIYRRVFRVLRKIIP